MQSAHRPRHRLGRVLASAAAAMLLASASGVAQAASPDRAALCDGYAKKCTMSSHTASAVVGQTLTVTVNGNRVPITLQVYRVEFNRDGELTGLVEMGEPVPYKVDGPGTVGLRVMEAPDALSGWGFVGLADEKGVDVSDRIGQFFGLGGTTLTLLGDGYAEQKPVGAQLDMHVLGHVPEVGYWVEYLDDTGAWLRAPDQGRGTSQRPGGESNDIGHLSYSVPNTLVGGRSYTFRTNTHLNYAGGKLISQPVFASWTVIPSENPSTGERGKNFDPTKGSGTPDPSAPPAPTGQPSPTGEPSPAPTGQPSPVPTGQPTPAPTGQPTPVPTGQPTPAPTGQPIPQPTRTLTAQPSPAPTGQPTPTPTGQPVPSQAPITPLSTPPSPSSSASMSPSAPPSPATPSQASSGAVWGEEETPDPLAVSAPIDSRISGLVAVAALLLVLAPALWWTVLRARGTARDREETL